MTERSSDLPSEQRAAHAEADRGRGAHGPVQRKYDMSWASVVFVMTTVFLAIGAINSQNNLLFWAFGVSVGGMIVSGFVSGAGLMGIRLERTAPRLARAGERVRLSYRVRNTARRMPVFGLQIRELGEFCGAGRASRFGDASRAETGVGYVPAGRTAATHAELDVRRRGVVSLSRVEVTSTAPFGLLRKTLVFDLPGTVAVGPARVPFRSSAATPAGQTAGPHRPDRRRVGHGEEFFALREYRTGDSPRMIAWRASARHDQLVVRQMMPPAPPRVIVRLAVFGSATPRALAERALSLAAEAVEAASAQGMSVAFDAGWMGVTLPFRSGHSAAEHVVEALARVELAASSTGRAVGASTFANRTGSIVIAASPGGARVDAADVLLVADDPTGWLPAGATLPEVDESSSAESRVRGRRLARAAAWARSRVQRDPAVEIEGAV